MVFGELLIRKLKSKRSQKKLRILSFLSLLSFLWLLCYHPRMHIRLSSCIGLPVLEEGDDHSLGRLSGILIDPDTGKIEGFFVRVYGLIGGSTVFCATLDIVRWGTRVYICSADALAPPEDRIRLQNLLEDPRLFLGQNIRTISGTRLGRCRDVQFNTDSMHVEWLFPRKWFYWGIALPISDVSEVTEEAIIVADPLKKESVKEEVPEEGLALPEIETKLG